MHILWLNSGLLLPLDKGGKLRTWHLMRHLARQHDITFLAFSEPDQPAAHRDGMLEVCRRLETVPRTDPAKGTLGFYADAARYLLDPVPYAVAKYRSAAYRARLETLLQEGRYDAVVCDFLPPVVNLPARLPCPAILFTHNVEAEIWRRHAETAGNPVLKRLLAQQWRRMRAFEEEALRRFDLVLAVSDADARTFERLYPGTLRRPVHVVQTGVDTEYFAPWLERGDVATGPAEAGHHENGKDLVAAGQTAAASAAPAHSPPRSSQAASGFTDSPPRSSQATSDFTDSPPRSSQAAVASGFTDSPSRSNQAAAASGDRRADSPARSSQAAVASGFSRTEPALHLVFTGSMDWLPNEDGMLYFVREILPRIRASEPGATLSIIGRSPTPAVRRLAEEAGVEVTGRVDDVRPHIAAGTVYVVPLRIGGGTRLKIFEAMAMAKAVVSTTIGAEGLPVTDGRNIVIADDPARFASEVVRLGRTPAARIALERAARDLVVRHYDWSAVAGDFERALTHACGTQARPGGREGTAGRTHEDATPLVGSM
jgi:glycosyltransferase involved in cell wall biosynthesis